MTGERRFGLDLLRAIAVLAVVYGHGEPLVVHAVPWYSLPTIDGVGLFFVLSGFLIGGILLKDIEQPGFGFAAVRRFWSRRWFRTLPAYFVTLVLLSAVHHWRMGAWPEELAAFVVFAQNLAWVHPPFFREAWSLTVEEWFYLSLPLLVLGGLRALRRATPRQVTLGVILAVIIAVTLLRAAIAASGVLTDQEAWDDLLRKQVVTRLDSLMYGVLGAWMLRYRPMTFFGAPRTLAVAGAALLVVDRLLQPHALYLHFGTLSVTPIAVLLMLPWLQGLQARPGRIVSAVTFVSLVSYSLYLLHASFVRDTLVYGLTRVVPKEQVPVVGMYLGYWALSLLAAWAMYRWVESPFMRLRERRSPERSVPARPAAAASTGD